ncbi:class I SAM-dependent methyltransferase [Ectothiorhodospiraceae bacterium WFHF3C12]|nr:class I SAM-dependent methyltransferase [Ectothiorhodospiraceae bacterium WFHF3C12]
MATVHSLNNLIVFRNSQGVQARGNLVKVSRTTLIFEVYNPYSIVQLSEVLHDVEIRSGDRVIYRGRAVVSGLVNTGLMLIVSASLLDPWSELIGLAGDSETIREQVNEFVEEWQGNQRIRPDYQLSVSRLRSFLSALNRWMEHLDFQDEPVAAMEPERLDALFEDLAQPLVPQLMELFQDFEVQAARVDEEERVAHMRYAQEDLHPLLMRAPFVHRTYHKPLGYAGDYEMVNMMLRDSREGPTIYAQLINTLYLETGPAEAHRNRIEILVDWLRRRVEAGEGLDRPLRVLNIGCGPAVELQRLLRREPRLANCQITLVDFSEETLNYTREQMERAMSESGVKPDIRYVQESVHGLLRRATKGDDGTSDDYYDVIYCAGLFDYLSDRICSRLLNLFHQWCVPRGEILATNVHPANPARNWMEHLLEWYLIYRDEAGMEKLGAPFTDHEIFRDSTGINIFLKIFKRQGGGR